MYANFPNDPAPEVYQLVRGKIYELHQVDPSTYGNACALRVSRALNPTIPGVAGDNVCNRT
jgi:hypothetical protein